MTKKIVALIIFAVFLFVSLFILKPIPTSASHCQSLAGLVGPHQFTGVISLNQNPNAKMTGRDCDLGEGQFKISNCIGTADYRYTVTYCTNKENSKLFPNGANGQFAGCEEQYDEQSNQAPAGCNRPAQGPPSKIGEIFGQINPPAALTNFGFGARGISNFLSNGVILIYSIATIVLIFMILWGAFEWLTSGGDKEKLSSAQKRIINAIIGIILFAVAFAVIRVLGVFTGFRFFSE